MVKQVETKTKKAWLVETVFNNGITISRLIRTKDVISYIKSKKHNLNFSRDRINAYVIPCALEGSTLLDKTTINKIAVEMREIEHE